jgi:hypothetical protein
MRLPSERLLRLLIVLAAFFALVNTTRPQDADPARQKSEVLGSGTSEPRIISTQMSISPVEKCKKKEHDTVTFSVVIDQYGKPRDYYFQSVQGNAVDDSLLDFARDVVRADSFSPALSAGLPVAVQRAISVDIEACAEQVKDSGGAKVDRITPRALPIQTVRPSPEIPPAINVDTPPAERAPGNPEAAFGRPVDQVRRRAQIGRQVRIRSSPPQASPASRSSRICGSACRSSGLRRTPSPPAPAQSAPRRRPAPCACDRRPCCPATWNETRADRDRPPPS